MIIVQGVDKDSLCESDSSYDSTTFASHNKGTSKGTSNLTITVLVNNLHSRVGGNQFIFDSQFIPDT